MRIAIKRFVDHQRVEIERDDAGREDEGAISPVAFDFPVKGPLPHDAVHFFVEREFAIARGFWGMVAEGAQPEEIQQMAKAGGHASAKRAGVPDRLIADLVRAERLVEAFEAQFWSGSLDEEAIIAMARSGWEASLVEPIALDRANIRQVYENMKEFARQWAKIDIGEQIVLEWPG